MINRISTKYYEKNLFFPHYFKNFIIETKTLMGTVMRDAALSLAEAKFSSGDFSQQILQNVNKATIKVKTKRDNVAGKTVNFFI